MLLSVIVFLPILFALIVAFLPTSLTRTSSLIFSSLHFILTLSLFTVFDPSSASLQLVENYTWLPELGVSYFLGIDGISFWLVLLTSFLTPIVIGASWSSVDRSIKAYHICLLVLQSAMIGSFVAFDSILFYIFFELSLIPMYFMVGIWGRRKSHLCHFEVLYIYYVWISNDVGRDHLFDFSKRFSTGISQRQCSRLLQTEHSLYPK